MKPGIRLAVLTVVLLTACVQKPAFEGENQALVRSSYPIVSVNGEQTEPVYRLSIDAGDVTAVIVYNTYRHDYYCTFSWIAAASTVYEVTDQENRYPLTLFRWVRTNSLWASRLDPTDPVECIKQPKR